MYNILKPETVWVENRCYRVDDGAITGFKSFEEHDLYGDDSQQNADVDEERSKHFEVSTVNGKFTTSFHVPKHYIGSIIGRRGATKMRIEHDMNTSIKIPKQGDPGDVVITGVREENVRAARLRINQIVVGARMRQRFTHFVSIPVNTDVIMENFMKFKSLVLSECPDVGIEDSVFIEKTKLHLTICVMCVMDNEERQIVTKLLHEARDKVTLILNKCEKPLLIHVKGISYMNDDPTNTHVLYANATEENAPNGVLQEVADTIFKHFEDNDFIGRPSQGPQVKLHVTLMNSRYRNRSTSEDDISGNTRDQRKGFNCSKVLEKFADFDFGVAPLSNLHLSQMHTISEDGYYQSTCVVPCYV